MSRKIFSIALVLVITTGLAQASQQYFRIVRLSYIEGRVSFQHMGDVDWSAASVNLALQPGDRLYTSDDGRAEVEFDEGSVLRLSEGTDVEFLTLSEELVQIRILLGLATLTVRSHTGFEISTPAAAFNTSRPGVYRFDILEDGVTDAIVRKGMLDAENQNFSLRIETGELVHVTPGDQGTHLVARYEQRDQWDEWNDRRNADLLAFESRQYLPDYVQAGVSDLDRYGNWVVVDTYGPAWVPHRVDPYWSPYWVGRWYHRPSWGWTWCSYEPWGWLPYHYGRWHFSANIGWCWLPGSSFGFHFWSPGLVRFHHGHGRVGWWPLGPGDYYNVNNYHYNPTYNYHLKNIRLAQHRGPGDLANRQGRSAFRSVTEERFVNDSLGGRGERRALADNDSLRLQRNMITDRLSVRPTSRSSSPLPDRAANGPSSGRDRATFVRNEPSVPTAGSNQFIRLRKTARTGGTARSSASPSSGTSGVADQRGTNSTPARATPGRDTSAMRSRTGGTGQPRPNGQSSAIGSSYVPRSRGRAYIIRNPAVNSRAGGSQEGRNNVGGGNSRSAGSSLIGNRSTPAVRRGSSTRAAKSDILGRSQTTRGSPRPNSTVIGRGNSSRTGGVSGKSSLRTAPVPKSVAPSPRVPSGKTNSRPKTARPPYQTNRQSASSQGSLIRRPASPSRSNNTQKRSVIQTNPRTRSGSVRVPSSQFRNQSTRSKLNSTSIRQKASSPPRTGRRSNVTRIAPSKGYTMSRSGTRSAGSAPRVYGSRPMATVRSPSSSSMRSRSPSRYQGQAGRSTIGVNRSGGRISRSSRMSSPSRAAPSRARPRRP